MPDYGKIIFKPKEPISLREHFLKYLGPNGSLELLPEDDQNIFERLLAIIEQMLKYCGQERITICDIVPLYSDYT